MICPYASFGSRAENDGVPPMNDRPPTFSVSAELRRHMTPPVFVLTSQTDRSTVTVAESTGDSPAVNPPLGFTFEILRWPKKATGQLVVSVPEANTRAGGNQGLQSAVINVILLIKNGQVFRAGGLLGGVFLPVLHTIISQHQLRLEDAKLNIGTELRAFARNTLEYIDFEAEETFRPLDLPPLRTKVRA